MVPPFYFLPRHLLGQERLRSEESTPTLLTLSVTYGVTYAVFGTTHLSALWVIGPLEDGDFDPAGYGGTIAGAFVAITMVVAFMVLYLLRMRPKIRTRS